MRPRPANALIVLSVAVLTAIPGVAQIALLQQASVPHGNMPIDFALRVDVDGDGLEDLFLGSTSWSAAEVHVANGGGYTLAAIVPTGAFPWDAAAGDLDGDGDLEIVSRNQNDITIYWNNTYNLVDVTIPAATSLGEFTILDEEGDGDLDLHFANGSVMFNDGAGSFGPPTPTTPPGRPFDLEGDGDRDFWFGGPTNLVVHRNDGAAGYTTITIPGASGVADHGNFDGDGHVDFVRVIYGPPYSTPVAFEILIGDGQGGFTAGPHVGTSLTTEDSFAGLFLEDLDKDGLDDVGLLVQSLPFLWLPAISLHGWLQDGAGGFHVGLGGPFIQTSATAVATLGATLASGSFSATVEDHDGDGDVDLLTTGIDGGSAQVFETVQQPMLTFVSGSAQTGIAGMPFPAPLEVSLRIAGGAPIAGAVVTFSQFGSGSPPVTTTATTNTAGLASVNLTASSNPGVDLIQVTAPGANGILTWFLVTPVATLTIVSGDGQSSPYGLPFSQPLIVEAVDGVTGLPVPGAAVDFTLSVGEGTLSPSTALTDALGRASTVVTPGSVPGLTVTATLPGYGGFGVSFSLTTTGWSRDLQIVSGSGQVVTTGEMLPAPLVCQVIDVPTGQPLAGIPVTFTAPPGSTVSANPVLTDANGLAQVTLTTAPGVGGPQTVSATAPGADPTSGLFTFFVRRLTVLTVPQSDLVVVTFANDQAGIPVIFAADSPLPGPGFHPTVFGPVHTTVTNPGPGFLALDGIGVFGPPDPTVVTPFSRVFDVDLASLAGLTLVFQLYGYDGSIAFPDNVFISNPVTLTF